uniref:Uncharacterized protein n=1 Tax=Anguilla anguilla TaxID=7936 RepID=A0A0E9PNZ9_ANGAN
MLQSNSVHVFSLLQGCPVLSSKSVSAGLCVSPALQHLIERFNQAWTLNQRLT